MATAYYRDGSGAKKPLPVVKHPHPQYAEATHNHYTEPDTGWLTPTLVAPWKVYGGSYAVPAYRRRAGIVYLKGLLRVDPPDEVSYLGSIMAVLPEGFRPATTVLALCGTSARRGTVYYHHAQRLDINGNGEIYPSYASDVDQGVTVWLSWSGISFLVDQ